MKQKQKALRRSVWASALAIVLCAAMLLGTTFAWFTDTISSTDNTIHSGTLKITLNDSHTAQPLFAADENTLWEPGYSRKAEATVANTGTLWLKYAIQVSIKDDKSGLANVLDVYTSDTDITSADLLTEDNKVGTVADLAAGTKTLTNNEPFGILAPKGVTEDTYSDSAPLHLVIKMQEGAGNQYQDQTIKFNIDVVATQYTKEVDGFNNPNYDATAQYPVLVSSDEDIRNILETSGGEVILTDDIAVENNKQLTVLEDTKIDFNGNTLTGTVEGGSFLNADSPVNLVLSDPKNDGTKYTIDGATNSLGGGGYWQIAGVAAWKPTVTIESGKYTHDSAVVLCQLQTSDPDAIGVVINGGTFDGKGAASVVADIIGTVIINDGTFNAHKDGPNSGECVYLSSGSEDVPTITTINGGTFKADARIFYVDPEEGYTQRIEVKGGTFNVGEGGKLVEVKNGSAEGILVITGGTFNVDPSEYVDTAKYNVEASNGTWTVTAK